MPTISPEPLPESLARSQDETRARVQRLAARGVPAPVIHALVGNPRKLDSFTRRYRHELAKGTAEADAAVSEALFDLALSGKSPPATLAWAKQRLGWNTSEDLTSTQTQQQAARDTQTAQALAALRTLLDQLATDKASCDYRAPELVEDCSSVTVTSAAG